jgi:hypothetical protein
MTSIVLSGFVGIATIKADPALDPLLGARPFLPAPAALTPIEQARQRFAEHLLNAPEVQAAFANLRADQVPARLVELSNNGIRRLDDESLRKRAVLIGKLYQAADIHSCAQLWQGTATTEQVNGLLGTLAPNDIDAWFALSEQAVLAELRSAPAARHPDGAQIDAAIDALLADLPPSQARRLQQTLNATVLSDSDACWAGRTFFGNVVALDEPYRSTLLLALVQTK